MICWNSPFIWPIIIVDYVFYTHSAFIVDLFWICYEFILDLFWI